MPPNLLAPQPSDPGSANPPTDQPLPPTLLAALEVPSDGHANPTLPLLFAAASAASSAWRGAALYRVQTNALVPLGTSGSQRATIGTLVEPLGPSWGHMFEPDASALVELVADDLELEDTDVAGLANGANRMMIGGEAVQFACAIPLGDRRWRLRGLLRGRGGTEPEAGAGHPAQTAVVLLDDTLVPLDAAEVPALASTSIAAIGTGDSDAVIAGLANAGLSRRPLTPVHPRLQVGTDAEWNICWTRRARGQWRWDDGVDVALIEEREAYLVGYGPTGAPFAAWSLDEPQIGFTQAQRAALLSAWGPADLWVRQVGTFGQSPPLFIASIS